MPTAPPPSRDAALEARVFWLRFKNEIAAAVAIAVIAVAGFAGYRLYTNNRDSAASELLGSAKSEQDYRQVITRYPNTAAGASAYLLLAEAQRKEKKFAEANATLQIFIDKNPHHELVSTARMAVAANLESMGKVDEALSMYEKIGASDPANFNAPLALISEVSLLKAKNRIEEARRVCETILIKYRLPGDQRADGVHDDRVASLFAAEAMRQLRLLKPSGPPKQLPTFAVPPMLAAPSLPPISPHPCATKPKSR
jgi:TolA-binding protein